MMQSQVQFSKTLPKCTDATPCVFVVIAEEIEGRKANTPFLIRDGGPGLPYQDPM